MSKKSKNSFKSRNGVALNLAETKTIRVKNIEYVQQLEHLPKGIKNLEELIEHVTDSLDLKRYAAICHNKDVDENDQKIKDHIHLVMQFENARSINNIAKTIGDKTNCFQKITKWNSACSYLVHRTESSKTKHSYDPNDVLASFDYPEWLDKITKQVETAIEIKDSELINQYLDQLFDGEITKEEVIKNLSGRQYAKAKTRIEAVCQKRLELDAEIWREEKQINGEPIMIVWIFGPAGAGKTVMGRKIAQQYSEKIYISGSSLDPFQHYEGERAVVLDDLRVETFKYQDLLRMLDPYNYKSVAAARYSDKPIAADVIIVTTPFSPDEFYRAMFGFVINKVDSFEQLARRLTVVMKITKNYTEAFEYSTKTDTLEPVKGSKKKNTLIEELSILDKRNGNDLYNKLTFAAPEYKEVPFTRQYSSADDCKKVISPFGEVFSINKDEGNEVKE